MINYKNKKIKATIFMITTIILLTEIIIITTKIGTMIVAMTKIVIEAII